MIGSFNVTFITGGCKEGKDGNKYYNISVMQDDEVLKMPCTAEAFDFFKDKKFKDVVISVNLGEYAGDKNYKCVGAVLLGNK